MSRRCLVTGATGFIGLPLCEALRGAGNEVIATVRRPAPALENIGIDVIELADLGSLDQTALAATMRGVQTIYHLAARTHSPDASALDYQRDNVIATERLTRAALAVNVEHLVFVSSIKAMGEHSGAQPLSPAGQPEPEDDYGRSKLAAEQTIMRLCGDGPTGFTIIRPPLVYGPGAPGNLERLIRLIDRGVPMPLAAVRNRRSMIGRHNLIDLLLKLISHPTGRIVHPHDGDWSTPDLIRHLAAAMNKPARLFPVPPFLLRLAARSIGRQAISDRLTGSLQLDDPWLRDILAWRAPVSAAAGLAEMAQHWASNRAGKAAR